MSCRKCQSTPSAFRPTTNLERKVSQLLKRPVGRPSYKPVVRYRSFLYQAASWNEARRVVAKVEFHFGELFPRVGFIVTNLTAPNREVVRFYKRGMGGHGTCRAGRPSGDMVFVSADAGGRPWRLEKLLLGQAGAYSHESLKRGFS